MKILVTICRILVGIVFVFSSIVKGIDPLGTTYKVEEYMLVFNTPWAVSLAFTLSIILCTIEFLIGILLIFNACKKITKWLLLLMMTFFLVTTFIDAVTNQVNDCGCFGDAIKLSNWETFWKNVVLMVPTFIIFFGQRKLKKFKQNLLSIKDIVTPVFAIGIMVSFCLYNYYNEPIVDFRAWKVGNHMMPKENERGKIESFVTYKNQHTGEEVEFSSADLMKYYEDSTWANVWQFVDSRVVDPNRITDNAFSMIGDDGSDHAANYIGSSGFLFIALSYNLKDASNKGLKELEEFCKKAHESHQVIFLTASSKTEIERLKATEKGFENIDFFYSDEKMIKVMIRSNPGLLLLKNGTIIGKWHYRNIPKFDENAFEKLAKKHNAN